ncbi:MAG: AI-2E family transporter, partial [Alistipes sp.]|nr:AI-2E family transporter [Alistipes sp.]
MPTVREQYWRYSLFVLILGLGIAIFIELTPFLGGLLGAATIYVLLRRQMRVLGERRRWRRSFAA